MTSMMRQLPETDILAILRAADTIIAEGGRRLLAKILKGSREKKVLQLELNTCPTYGYFKSDKLDDVIDKIDWMIDNDFLAIEYSGKLPMIIFTDRGWEIESDQRATEFLNEWNQWLSEGKTSPDMLYLKDRNRKMILLFLQKIRETDNRKYIPYLKEWEKIDYRKVRAEIQATIQALESEEPADQQSARDRDESIKEALKGSPPQDIILKCRECTERFTFTAGEQQFYKQKGFDYPSRCKPCRERKHGDYLWLLE